MQSASPAPAAASASEPLECSVRGRSFPAAICTITDDLEIK